MVDWNEVASILDRIAGTSDDTLLDHGQKALRLVGECAGCAFP